MSNTLSLEQYIIQGIKQQIAKAFRIERPVFVASDAMWRSDSLRHIDQKTVYPLSSLKLMSIRLPESGEHFPVKALTRHSNISMRSNTVLNQKFVPTIFLLEFRFATDDFEEVLRISSLWMFAAVRNRINFTLNYLGVNIDISISLGKDLSIPSKTIIGAVPNEYEFLGQITVLGYMSNDDSRDRFDSVIVETVNSAVSVGKKGEEGIPSEQFNKT